ncbi:MAG: ATP-binding protein [Labilithrix sp.]
MSAEVALLCRKDGTISWADVRAQERLGAKEGTRFDAAAVPGTASKVAELVARATATRVERVELSLLVHGKALTYAFSGQPCGDAAMLVGHLLTEDERATFGQVAETMTELGALQREADRQRKQLEQSYREILDSNRALTTMHAVLDDKNDELRRAADVKSRVVSNVSHEFRTPINSILGLTQLLLDRLDGDLTAEQEKQVRFVRSSAEALSELVNDLLDLSRIEAGRHELRASKFDVTELFSSLRGMMKPLVREGVDLIFDEIPLVQLDTDRGKVSQILRNLVSNAIKFTEKGTIRVHAEKVGDDRLRFSVTDTGIGIVEKDLPRVFEEFTQIDSEIQRRVKGTGLGLTLARKLAEMLGGTLTAQSKVGEGSTFTLDLPRVHEEVAVIDNIAERAQKIDSNKQQVLVVEDNRQTMFFYERYLVSAGFQVVPARTVEEARKQLARVRPAAIVLDVVLEGEATWGFLAELKESPETRDIPVMVVTIVDRSHKARALGADEFWLKPIDGDRMIRKLAELSKRGPVARILVIDDDEQARYLIRRLLSGAPYTVFEAADGASGLELARTQKPDVILLDFLLLNETAFDVIDDLKADPVTRSIPIIIQTAKTLDETERAKLERETAAILKKQSLSREIAITRIREALEAAGVRGELTRTS